MKTVMMAICLFSVSTAVLSQEDKVSAGNEATYEEWRLKQRAELKDLKEVLNREKRKAEILKDKDKLVLIQEQEVVLNEKAKCFEKEDDLEVDVCLRTTYKKLADSGNFVAQNDLGFIFENNYQNRKMAIYWYKKSMENAKTPNVYKYTILEDVERLEKGQAPKE